MIIVLIVALATVLALIFPGYFPMHDDLQVMRIFQLEKCFADGQIPCRWATDMAFGYGQAMFNYYSALPYYLGILVRLVLPVSILDTVKLLFAGSLVAGSLGMYFLSRKFFNRNGAIIASVLYALAPYRAVNVYVRGALAESYSLAILPFLWLSVYKAIKEPTYKNSVFLALALGALLITHNVSTLMYFAFTAIWALFWLLQNLKLKNVWSLVFGVILGIFLAGFFIIPVAFERSLIKEELFISDYSHFAGHFVTLKQLFLSRFWGYGGSIFGENDGMAFQVGWPHWWVGVFSGIVALASLFKKTEKKESVMVLWLLGLALFSMFLAHNKSTFLWIGLPPLQFVQFPWRFLGIAVFLLSLASGGIVFMGKTSIKSIIAVGIILAALVLNIGYFRPERTYDWLTDEIKLSGADYAVSQKAAFLDYLPVTVDAPPLDTAPEKPEIVSGEGEIPNFTKTSSTFFFDAKVHVESVIDIPIIYFPHWDVYTLEGQGQRVTRYPGEGEGLLRIVLPEGNHMVYGRLVNTQARVLGNSLTVLAFFVLISGAILTANKKQFPGLK